MKPLLAAGVVFGLAFLLPLLASGTDVHELDPEDPGRRYFLVVEGQETPWRTHRWTFPATDEDRRVKVQQFFEFVSEGDQRRGGGTIEFQVFLAIGEDARRLQSITLQALGGSLGGRVHAWMPENGYPVEAGSPVVLEWRYRTEEGGSGWHDVTLESPTLLVLDRRPVLGWLPAVGIAAVLAAFTLLGVGWWQGRRARPATERVRDTEPDGPVP